MWLFNSSAAHTQLIHLLRTFLTVDIGQWNGTWVSWLQVGKRKARGQKTYFFILFIEEMKKDESLGGRGKLIKKIFKVFNFVTHKYVCTVLRQGSITNKTNHDGFLCKLIKTGRRILGIASLLPHAMFDVKRKMSLLSPQWEWPQSSIVSKSRYVILICVTTTF